MFKYFLQIVLNLIRVNGALIRLMAKFNSCIYIEGFVRDCFSQSASSLEQGNS